MNCDKCGSELDEFTELAIQEANNYLSTLGKDASIKPFCADCLDRKFGEVLVN